MELAIKQVDLSDLFKPKVRGHVVNPHVVQQRPWPKPDFEHMQRVIDAGRALTKKAP